MTCKALHSHANVKTEWLLLWSDLLLLSKLLSVRVEVRVPRYSEIGPLWSFRTISLVEGYFLNVV